MPAFSVDGRRISLTLSKILMKWLCPPNRPSSGVAAWPSTCDTSIRSEFTSQRSVKILLGTTVLGFVELTTALASPMKRRIGIVYVFSVENVLTSRDLLPTSFSWPFGVGCEDALAIFSMLSQQLFSISASHEANLVVPALYLVGSFSQTYLKIRVA
jgi:hypothetical protein